LAGTDDDGSAQRNSLPSQQARAEPDLRCLPTGGRGEGGTGLLAADGLSDFAEPLANEQLVWVGMLPLHERGGNEMREPLVAATSNATQARGAHACACQRAAPPLQQHTRGGCKPTGTGSREGGRRRAVTFQGGGERRSGREDGHKLRKPCVRRQQCEGRRQLLGSLPTFRGAVDIAV
jgi:hypothetical protein